MRISRRGSSGNGFTLLEVMAALLLMAAIIGMVFAIARTSLQLSKTIVDKQNSEMEQQAFFDLLNRRFSSLPGDARLDLEADGSGNQYLSTLTFQNVPMTFNWGGEEQVAKAIQLATVQRRSGYLDIVLRFYQDDILDNTDKTNDDEQPFAEIVLLKHVAYFEWRALNPGTMEWQDVWKDSGSLPLQMELVMAIGAKGENMRQVFWIPPKVNPELIMRQLESLNPASGSSTPNSQSGNKANVDLSVRPATSTGGGGR